MRFDPGRSPGGEGVLRVHVTDTGIGLSAAAKARLFQPFQQADNSITRTFGGTGLGLSISSRLVELMRGSIGVDSEEGKGATFWFTLPATVVTQRSAELADLTGVSVLLVGADRQQNMLITRHLTARGAQASSTAKVPEALAHLADHGPIDVVLVDLDWMAADGSVEFGRLVDLASVDAKLIGLVPVTSSARATPIAPEALYGRVTVPIRRRALITMVGAAAGRIDAEAVGVPSAPLRNRFRPPAPETAAAKGALILVAEDNETNRLVISKVLTRLGYAAELVENGKLALEALRPDRHGMVITDCHMPVMDGYAFARAVRGQEGGDDGQRRVPIVALTADAVAGTVRKCLEAGMDDYLAKPIDVALLDAAVRKWLPVAVTLRAPSAAPTPEPAKPTPPPAPAPTPVDPGVFDVDRVLDAFGTMDAATIAFLDKFLASARGHIEDLHGAMNTGDVETATAVAHTAKGACNAVGGYRLARVYPDWAPPRRTPAKPAPRTG